MNTRHPRLEIAVARNDPDWPKNLDALAERVVASVLASVGAKFNGPCELSILLTNDAEQRQLNHAWRKLDKTTNVLSFPQIEPFAPLTGLLGDVVLARETLAAEAKAEHKDFADHFAHLLAHGFLHILGYDHIEAKDALVMEGLETQIMLQLGIADPYAVSKT